MIVNKTQSGNKLPSSLERARLAARLIVDNKGEDVRILDLREITQAFDFFVIGSGTSRRQLHAISDEIDEVFEKQLGDVRNSISGYQESRWVVLDYGDVVVHLFEPETREYYALEDLWGKGKEIPLDAEVSKAEVQETPVAPIVEDESNN
ncbi:MAG: ribosome silencing factor [Thermoguttaceae bacterium]|nr:ribosome silencing factor [Thermoguttaceae bacterium]MBR4750720.1 ribosome silencing factor [Thermoguttaceae bacterium]MBR5758729.1 ribosome silencing factor [Thermoguttaceae bacterium]